MSLNKTTTLVIVTLVLLDLESCSKNPNQYLATGEQCFKVGKYPEAVIHFRNAIQLNPKLAEAHYQLARTYVQLKSLQEAYREFRQTVTLDPKNLDAQLQMAGILIAGRKYDEAKAAATMVLATDSGNARAHAILGDVYALQHDRQNAIREFQLAIKLEPEQVQNYAALGAVYRAAGQLADAEATYKSATKTSPRSVEAHVNMGEFDFSQRKFDDAEAEMRAGSELEPSAPLPRLLLANYYVATGKLAAAEELCAELKRIAPDDPRAYRALALLYESTGQKEKAAAELQSLRASKPKDRWVTSYLAETLLDLNRSKEAGVLVQEVLGANPNDAQALVANGRILMGEGRYQQAISVLENAVKSDPKSAAGYYFLGVAQKSVGLAEMAKASFAHAHELSPGMIGAKVALAELDAKKGVYEVALGLAQTNPEALPADIVGAEAAFAKGNLRLADELLRIALNRDPASLPALELLVKLGARQGKTQEAVDAVSGVISQHPEIAGLHFLLAQGYFNLRDLRKSEASVRQAVAMDPKMPDAHALLAKIDYARGLIDQAIVELQAEIDTTPHSKVSNYLALEGLYEKKGNWAEAKKTSERALAADPTSGDAANNLAYLNLEHGGDVNTALSLAQQAKRAMPGSPFVADTLGWAYYKLGSSELAIAQFKECIQKIPGNPVYQYHLGMAYLSGGHFDLAARFLQQALQSNPSLPDADAAGAIAALDTIAKRPRK